MVLRAEHHGAALSGHLAASKNIFQFATMALGIWQVLFMPALQEDALGQGDPRVHFLRLLRVSCQSRLPEERQGWTGVLRAWGGPWVV